VVLTRHLNVKGSSRFEAWGVSFSRFLLPSSEGPGVGSRFRVFFTDFGFKKLFGEEQSKEVLKGFLFHILSLESEIVNISLLPKEQLPSAEDERLGIYDLYCVDEKGDRFIVEMQRASQMYFKDRSIYYSTFPIAPQAQRGDWDYQLNAVYCVGILNFNLTEDLRYIRCGMREVKSQV